MKANVSGMERSLCIITIIREALVLSTLTRPLEIPIGINYKVLMSGEVNPLTILSSALNDNNVHVVAKFADKIPIKVRFHT